MRVVPYVYLVVFVGMNTYLQITYLPKSHLFGKIENLEKGCCGTKCGKV